MAASLFSFTADEQAVISKLLAQYPEPKLGDSWIITDSPEIRFAEKVYQLFDFVSLLLSVFHKKYLTVVGSMRTDPLIFKK